MKDEHVKKILYLADNIVVRNGEVIHVNFENNVLGFIYYPEMHDGCYSFCCDIIDWQMTLHHIHGYEIGGFVDIEISNKNEIIKLLKEIIGRKDEQR
jgi:hypothetical protein